MSYPTVPAFVQTGDFSDESRKHPVGKWIEEYTKTYDQGMEVMGSQLGKWHTPDWTVVKADGSVHSGTEAAWAAIQSVYGVLTDYHHQPYSGVYTETSDGYSIAGFAELFYTLVGQGQSAGATDNNGKHYDGKIPGAFRFTVVKSGSDGFLLKKTELFSDSGPVVVQLLARGVIKPADIGL